MISKNMKLDIFLCLIVVLVHGYEGKTVRKRECLPPPNVCGNIPQIENGVFSGMRLQGSVATLTCDEGFIEVIGQSSIICLSDGNWEEVVAECVKPESFYVTVFPRITENSESINDRIVAIATFIPNEVVVRSVFESVSTSLNVTESTEVSFSTNLTLETNDDISNRVIVIRGNESLTVHTVAFRRRGGGLGYYGFLVRPVEQLTDEYILLVPTIDPQFNVIAIEDNTTVTIELSNGSTLQRTLNRFEVYTFIADGGLIDFSGTSIKSNNKISVIAGSPNTRIPSNSGQRDGAAVQLIGVSQWSNDCILAPFFSSSGDFPFEYKVIASNNNTIVSIRTSSGTTNIVLNEGEVFTDMVLDNEVLVIEATENILVGQFSFSSGGGIRDQDPSMVLCQPRNAFLSSYIFRVLDINVNNNSVRVIIESESAGDLLLNGVEISNSTYGTLSVVGPGGTNYTIIYIEVQEESTNILNTTSGAAFGADYYGFGNRRQLAFNLGWGYS